MSEGGGQPMMDLHDLLHPDEQRRFRRLCLPTDADELRQMTDVVDLHIAHIKRDAGPATDVETAESIATSLIKLIASDIDFDAEARAQIRGAIEYYVLTDDAAGDMDDVLGFDDDARVLNVVLERIGHPEFAVELPS